MPSSCIWSIFSRCPFLTPIDHLSKGKRGTCKNRQQNKEAKTRGYNANNTSTHLPPLELMPFNAFLMYLEPFFKVPSSDPFHNQSKEKRAPAKTCNKTKKNKRPQLNNTSKHLPSLELMPCNAFLMYLEHFFKVPSSDPFHNQSKEKRAPAKTCKTKKKHKATTKQHLKGTDLIFNLGPH